MTQVIGVEGNIDVSLPKIKSGGTHWDNTELAS